MEQLMGGLSRRMVGLFIHLRVVGITKSEINNENRQFSETTSNKFVLIVINVVSALVIILRYWLLTISTIYKTIRSFCPIISIRTMKVSIRKVRWGKLMKRTREDYCYSPSLFLAVGLTERLPTSKGMTGRGRVWHHHPPGIVLTKLAASYFLLLADR